ncbi:MAG: hypothetical protein ACOC6P_02515 [Candidatus Aminicenantaceae bacterium]
MKKIKIKIKFIIIFLPVFLFLSCSSQNIKIKIDVPGEQNFSINQYKNFVVLDFIVPDEKLEFDLNDKTKDFFISEARSQFQGNISSDKLKFEKDEVFKDKTFWKSLSPQDKTVFLTGKIGYEKQIRKFIENVKGSRFEDPFEERSRLAERKFFKLTLTVCFIDSQSGEILYNNKFEESKSDKNPNQTSYFAFYELMQKIKIRLFRDILEGKKFQQRHLITK